MHMQKMASCKWETYQIEPKTYVLFVFELDDECRIIEKNINNF